MIYNYGKKYEHPVITFNTYHFTLDYNYIMLHHSIGVISCGVMQQSNDRALMLCHIPMQLLVLSSCSWYDTKLTKIETCNYSIEFNN